MDVESGLSQALPEGWSHPIYSVLGPLQTVRKLDSITMKWDNFKVRK